VSKHDAEMRARLKAQRDAATDPVERETYALAERAGFDWFDTESNARQMASHAAGEIIALRTAHAELLTAMNRLLASTIDACGVIHEYVAMPVKSLSDKFPATVSRLTRRIQEAHAAVAKAEGVK
jgi:hypothetical protein